METNRLILGDCLDVLRGMPSDSVDLIFGSPPYENCRTYGIDFNLKGQAWVNWMVAQMAEMERVCRGLVCMIVEGKTEKFRWSATPALLMADLHRAGFNLRKPPAFYRIGIPGSGGPDFWRNDYEFCICITRPGKLVWSDNIAMGHPPLWGPGGAMSHRCANGERRNQWGGTTNGKTEKLTGPHDRNGKRRPNGRPSHRRLDRGNEKSASTPAIANPGNIVNCGAVGGGNIGSILAHENEAPFPEFLAECFIRSFCPPDGIVLDPFCGSGTTCAVAEKWGRRWIGIDIRESQIELSRRRIKEEELPLLAGGTNGAA